MRRPRKSAGPPGGKGTNSVLLCTGYGFGAAAETKIARRAAAEARRYSFMDRSPIASCIQLPHQSAKPRHRGHRSKGRLESFDATPQHRLVAVDDRLPEGVLNLCNRLDLRGVGAAQEDAIGVGAVVFTREL